MRLATPGQSAVPVRFRASVRDSLYRDSIVTLLHAPPDQVMVIPAKNNTARNTALSGKIRLDEINAGFDKLSAGLAVRQVIEF